MSLASEIAAGFSQAQGLFAQAQGAPAADSKNFQLAGAAYQGVLNEVKTSAEGTASGVEIVRELQIVATRDQFGAKPDPAKRLTVAALDASWTLADVSESSTHFFLTCVPA
jgi:hypothetical protein